MPEENVKVAVRVRPFRERARNATCIVDMKGPSTYLQDPEDPNSDPRSFTFDHSYWSHDGCKEDGSGYFAPDSGHPNGKKFADQKTVFNDLGVGVYNNAWEGFNSTLFAYGQTGSGKSWSVVGYGINKGIVPQFCEKIYNGIEEKKKAGEPAEYEVMFSMLEIYMEEVRDLLGAKQKGGLRIRQHPKKGFYADGLTVAPVSSYKDIESKMEEGTMNRTVAATQMNATSSRAHTIVGITFIQKFKNAAGEETTKSALVNLVDLAGSERAENTGATGDRLKEGAAINTSLSALGNCIAALADQASGKNVKVPYRDSSLTKLLRNALAGNSKTIMIAAISPADINYEETLSTLRYADRAKQIKTKAVVNEDPTEKLIRELQEENEKLKQMLESGGIQMIQDEDGDDGTEGMSAAEKEAYKKELAEDYQRELEENEKEMEEMKKAFEEKLRAYQESGGQASQEISQNQERRKKEVHIWNVNFDPQLSGKIVHFVSEEKVTVGRDAECNIKLHGPSIQPQHAIFTLEGGKVFIEKALPAARLLVNGEAVTEKTEVNHNDRIMLGTTQMFGFSNPQERDKSKQSYPQITFDMLQEEIAANSGFDMSTENKTRDEMLLQEDLLEMRPAVEEANSISEELDMKKRFEVVLASAQARGQLTGRHEIFVRVVDLETDLEWMWTKEKFLNRKYVMQELFQKYEEGENYNVPADRDPFIEDPNAEIHIGSVQVWLQSLAYNIESVEQLEITDFKGQEVGMLNVEVFPCDKKGKDYSEKDDKFVDNPQNLVGSDFHFNVKLPSARGLPSRFTDVYAKYSVYLDDHYESTKVIKDTTNPDFKFCKLHSFNKIDEKFVRFLETESIMLQIWGKQKPPKTTKKVNTKSVLEKQSLAKGLNVAANSQAKVVDANKVRFAMELATAKKRAEKAEQKVHHMKQLIASAEEQKKPRLSTRLVKDVLNAPSQDAADKCIKMVAKEPGEGEENVEPKSTPSSKGASNSSDGAKSSTCVLL